VKRAATTHNHRVRVRKLRAYPLSEASNPKPNRYASISGKVINTLPPEGLEYWARLSPFINNNPVQERDRFFMAMLNPLGIEKGKPFKPDERQRAILEEAARMVGGDILLSVQGMPFASAEDRAKVLKALPCDELRVTVFRDDRVVELATKFTGF